MSELFRDEYVLCHDPFQGDFGDSGDRTLKDKIVTARKGGECHDYGGSVLPGTRIRSRTDVADGEMMSFKWCTECCAAQAIYGENPDILEALIAMRDGI